MGRSGAAQGTVTGSPQKATQYSYFSKWKEHLLLAQTLREMQNGPAYHHGRPAHGDREPWAIGSITLRPSLHTGKLGHRETKYPAQWPLGFEPQSLSAMPAMGLEGSPPVMTGPGGRAAPSVRCCHEEGWELAQVGSVEGCQILQVPPKHSAQRNQLPLTRFSQDMGQRQEEGAGLPRRGWSVGSSKGSKRWAALAVAQPQVTR